MGRECIFQRYEENKENGRIDEENVVRPEAEEIILPRPEDQERPENRLAGVRPSLPSILEAIVIRRLPSVLKKIVVFLFKNADIVAAVASIFAAFRHTLNKGLVALVCFVVVVRRRMLMNRVN